MPPIFRSIIDESALAHRSEVLVIFGSTRAGRQRPRIAAWVIDVARTVVVADYELVDLADWQLPMDDEPDIPALGSYTKQHTRAWSDKVAGANAVIIVTPQYNWGYPAPLKNALDHLYAEWAQKPVVIVTYGGHGGIICADQLRQVLDGLKMRPTATMPALTLTDAMVRGAPVDPAVDFATHADVLRQAIRELAECLPLTDAG